MIQWQKEWRYNKKTKYFILEDRRNKHFNLPAIPIAPRARSEGTDETTDEN